MSKLLIGADPEVFVRDKASGDIVSAIDLVPGTKEEPFKTKHGFVQRDNVLAEFNIEPANNPISFCKNILEVLEDLNELLAKQGKTSSIISSYEMNEMYLSHYESRRFGCDPDFNVWDLSSTHQVNSGMAGNLRTAGGHIHIGFNREVSVNTQIEVAKACDIFLGLPSILLDEDKQRRKLYGQAGHFRPKDYGIEYRVLSNFWLKHTNLMEWAYFQAKTSWESRWIADDITEKDQELVQQTINNGDKVMAKKLCAKFGVETL